MNHSPVLLQAPHYAILRSKDIKYHKPRFGLNCTFALKNRRQGVR